MNKWLREFRLIPVLLIAAGSLLALKAFGLVFDGGYTLGERLGSSRTMIVTTAPATAMPSVAASQEMAAQGGSRSWMQEMFNYPDITGSVAAKPKEPAAGEGEKKPAPAPPPTTPGGTVIPLDQQGRPASAAERALLERLQTRRQELDARARELDLREGLLKDAEKKLEGEAAMQKAGDAKDGGTPGQRKEVAETARMKGVVTMYETMKPKEAAKIFDRLDIRVLLDLATQIKPQIMSAILAQMSAEAAERLTVEMAAKGGGERGTVNPSTLPKIDGKPDGT